MVGIDWWEAGGWGLFVLSNLSFVIMLLRGDIVPGKIARNYLDAWQTEREAGRVRDDQINELLETSRVTTKFIEDLRKEIL